MKKTILTIIVLIFLQNILFAQLYVSEKNGKYGYVNEQGNVIIGYKYDEAGDFFLWRNYAIVKRDNKKYLVYPTGTEYLVAE